ncbi:hypothetical protein [Halalkalicoccus salilacus]|uniref:hypothetical protein n=1 Tax=Halalkalicoccus sp. GCM10025704 TaxID=3252662 RepID=UPI00360C26EE
MALDPVVLLVFPFPFFFPLASLLAIVFPAVVLLGLAIALAAEVRTAGETRRGHDRRSDEQPA